MTSLFHSKSPAMPTGSLCVCVYGDRRREKVCVCVCKYEGRNCDAVHASAWSLRLRMHAKPRLLPRPADVFVTPDTITYYVFSGCCPSPFTTEWEK